VCPVTVLPCAGPDRPVHVDVRARSQRMVMLAEVVELVIGVDTHKHTTPRRSWPRRLGRSLSR
jgi:hypothetical protein